MRYILSNKLFYVFLLGFCLRFYACVNTPVINPDGVHYIQQAKAIYYGEWQSLRSTLSYVANYPFFIAGAYKLCNDWIIAARSISLLFGFATLIPLYLLLKRFFSDTISALCILIFSLIPVFVSRSGDVVRDPVFWFFGILGLYFFIAQIDNKKRTPILFSNISFLLASWARIEGILFIAISCVYLIFFQKEHTLQRLFVFLLPLLLIISVAVSFAAFSDIPIAKLYRTNEIVSKFPQTLDQYHGLRANLKDLAAAHGDSRVRDFLGKSRNLVWLIALGTVCRYAVAAFFYPFFLIFLIGLIGVRKRIRNDKRVFYFFLLVIAALLLLYLQVMHEWIIQYRFLAVVILPSCIFLGFGLEKIVSFVREKFDLKEYTVLIIVVCLLLASALPKNLKSRETDKAVFRQIGELIAERGGPEQVNKVAGSSSKFHRWVSFYANVDYPGIFRLQNQAIRGNTYSQFFDYARKQGIQYLLWEEKQWPAERFDLLQANYDQDFKRLGCWSHPDTGRVILFERI
ncbi:MAG: ArnT family glycosyltransferase, partial [Thermodesulfobacteriota bacterium]